AMTEKSPLSRKHRRLWQMSGCRLLRHGCVGAHFVPLGDTGPLHFGETICDGSDLPWPAQQRTHAFMTHAVRRCATLSFGGALGIGLALSAVNRLEYNAIPALRFFITGAATDRCPMKSPVFRWRLYHSGSA